MHNDIRGLPVTIASADAVTAFDHAIDAYLSYRSDIMPRMEALFAADPDCGMAHVLKGYLMLLGYKSQLVPIARAAAETAAPLLRHATTREQAHLRALTHWVDGDTDKAAAVRSFPGHGRPRERPRDRWDHGGSPRGRPSRRRDNRRFPQTRSNGSRGWN